MFVHFVLTSDICTKESFINFVLLLQCLISLSFSSSSSFRILSVRICLNNVCIGQSTDDSYTTRQAQQQSSHSNGINSDDERESSNMFQANYQYTPLKEYAAMRTITTVTSPTNGTVETPVSNGYRSNENK